MATRSFKVYQGEDLSPEFDYTDALKWEEIEVGSKAFNGESTLSTVVIRDEFGETGNEIGLPSGLTHKSLAARNVVKLTLGSNVLWSGRIGVKDYSRDGRQSERYRNAHVQLFDRNKDLDEIIVDGNFNRGAETDVARVQGLVASFYSGVPGQIGPVAGLNPRPTTRLNGSNSVVVGSNLVSLPAQDYTRTSALEVLRGIAATANKLFFVTEDGATLFYDGHDSSAYQSPLVISDRNSDIRGDATGWTFPPIWNVGAASTEDGMEQRAGLRLYYGAGGTDYVDAYSETVANQYAHTAEIIFDDTIVDASQAQKRVNREVDRRSKERRTYSCSVGPLTDDQIPFVKVGQLVRIKARAIPDADDQYVSRRIVELKITTPVPGTWFAHMRLDQPLGRAIVPGSPPGPAPVGDTTTTGGVADSMGGPPDPNGLATLFTIGSGANQALYVFVQYNPPGGGGGADPTGVIWYPDGTDAGSAEALTQLAEVTNSGTTVSQMRVYRLLNPTPSVNAVSKVSVEMGVAGSSEIGSGIILVGNVNQSTPEGTIATAQGTGTTSSVTASQPAGGVVINAGAWLDSNVVPTEPVALSGQTSIDTDISNASPGTGAVAIGIGYGDATPGWNFTDSRHWCAIAVPVNGGTGGISIGGPSEGTTGSSGTYVPGGTVIEHGDLSGKGGTMHDATQVEFDPTGLVNTDATQLQEAVEDLDAAISGGGAPTTADYLVGTAQAGLSAEIVVGTSPGGELGGTWASPTVDATHSGSAHTDFIAKSLLTTQDDIIVRDATGPARLAKGTDGQVLTVDPTTHHLVWADPPAGGSLDLDDLTDVDTTGVSDGDVLTYDSGGSEWVPAAPTGGGGGGATIQYPGLKPATPTYDFAGASLSGDFSAHSSLGSFTTSNVMTQGADWGGSSVELQFSAQAGAIYVAHANTDFDFTVGGIMFGGLVPLTNMFGIAALNSSGTGVGITSYTDGNAYLATISGWGYSSFSDSWGGAGHSGYGGQHPFWMRLKRVSGTWTAYMSFSGRAWDKTFATRADSIAVAYLAFGLFYDLSGTYNGRIMADYFHVDV